MKLIVRFITALYFELIELIKINATLNENEKLNTIVVAFLNSAAINLVDDLNKEDNLIDVDSYATKEILLETAEECLLSTK